MSVVIGGSMRILYVVSRPLEINTSASVRNHATISGLIQNGHQVTLVSASPDKNHEAYDPTLSVVPFGPCGNAMNP